TNSSRSWCFALLIGPGRGILEKLRHSLLQIPVVLVRVFLEVDGLDCISPPDHLLSSSVIQVHHQYPDGNGRSLALHCTVIQSPKPTPAARGTACAPSP